jgi:N6-L-threonylcarbamoyladenine synthase
MKTYILGIDTSAYTTSIAIVNMYTGSIEFNLKKLLSVPAGQKGLRQQEAVFQHLNNFQELLSTIDLDLSKVSIVSVSSRPRNIKNSYMPVFTVGQNYGKVIAKTLNCSYIEYSHQENHISASLIDSYKEIKDNILAIHISGGTTEFLTAKKSNNGYDTEIVGGSKDITFGQLIDRIGTYMAFSFPCGLYMEEYIKDYSNFDKTNYPAITKSPYINLSGIENYYKNLIDNNKYNKHSIIFSLFEYIAKCIINVVNILKENLKFKTIIITGGVAANSVIRNAITEEYSTKYSVMFPSSTNSSDNAIGVAYLPIIDRWYNET